MFGFKSLFSNKDGAKNVDDSPLGALSQNLNEAKEKADKLTEISNDNFDDILEQAIQSFKDFVLSEDNNASFFDKAKDGLVKASELKPSKPEPYYYLACLFHIFGENETAMKYLKVVELIEPEYDGIEELKEDITRNFSLST